jgi:hypothetical protein
MGGAAWGQVEPLGVKWSRLGSSGSDPSWNKNIKQFYVKQNIGGKRMKYKNKRKNERNNKVHFPQVYLSKEK